MSIVDGQETSSDKLHGEGAIPEQRKTQQQSIRAGDSESAMHGPTAGGKLIELPGREWQELAEAA